MLGWSGFKRELEKRSWDNGCKQLSSSFVAKRSKETVVAGRGRVDFVKTGGETRWLYEKDAPGRRMDAIGEMFAGKLS